MSRNRTSLICLVLCMTVGCASAPPSRTRVLHLRVAPAATFGTEHRVSLQVTGPDGAAHEATGVIAMGGTTRALVASMLSSLERRGCAAHSADANTDADELVRAMEQLLILPDGWTVAMPVAIEARAVERGSVSWGPSNQLTITAADGAPPAKR